MNSSNMNTPDTTQQGSTGKGAETPGLRRKRDGDLLRLYAAGRSQPAFAELRRRYARLVYSTCLREIGDPTLAEDAAQGVFLLLSEKAHRLEKRETLADWLYTASRHVSRNLHKQERRRQMNEARAVREAASEALRQDAADPLWEQVEPHLDDALGRLKPADREAVLLRFMQQQSLAEVGAGLGVSENTARMRVQRSLAKIRAHLSRAGVAVTLALLATLLLEHGASALPDALLDRLSAPPAAPPGVRIPSVTAAVRRVSLLLLFLSALRPLAVLVVALAVLVGIVQVWRVLPPPRMSPSEQRRAFQTIEGTWRGSLEYADDRTGQHFTYPTTVTARSLGGGNGFSFVAAYTGSTAVDRTTFTGGARAGTFTVTNGGAQSSHRLAGVGELVKLRGGFAFQGKSPGRDADVRMRFTLGTNSLTIQEEYRPRRQTDYRFRNRFILRRQ